MTNVENDDRQAEQDEIKAQRDEINSKLDEVRDLLVESGTDEATADALVGFARPSTGGTVVGNFADLQRMGAVAVEGKIPKNSMPPGQEQEEVEASSLEEAFASPPLQPTDDELAMQAGVSPSSRRTDEEEAARQGGSNVTDETQSDAPAEGEQEDQADASSTKAELMQQAQAKGVQVDESMTKAEIVQAINNA